MARGRENFESYHVAEYGAVVLFLFLSVRDKPRGAVFHQQSRAGILRSGGDCYYSDDDIGRLMHDFLCSDPDDMYTQMLADKVRYLKNDPKGVDIMCKVMEDLREESLQRGKETALLESIRNIMIKLKYTAQQAMELLEIPATDQSKYLAKL